MSDERNKLPKDPNELPFVTHVGLDRCEFCDQLSGTAMCGDAIEEMFARDRAEMGYGLGCRCTERWLRDNSDKLMCGTIVGHDKQCERGEGGGGGGMFYRPQSAPLDRQAPVVDEPPDIALQTTQSMYSAPDLFFFLLMSFLVGIFAGVVLMIALSEISK